MRSPAWCSRIVLLLLSCSLVAAAWADSKPSPAAAAAYGEGLDALRDGRFADAVPAFGRAMEHSDDPEFVLARGVALVLAEQFKQALPDLQRARTLGMKSREPELWIYAAESMGYFATRDHIVGGPLRLRDGRELADNEAVSVPGHMVQGRADYNTEYASAIIYEMAYPYGPNRRTGRGPADEGQVRAAMLKVAQAFAEHHGRRGDLAPGQAARGRDLLAAGRPVQAMRELKLARSSNPGDAGIMADIARTWLDYGRPATARKEFTAALTRRTDLAAGYLGRAMAAAQLGDARRVLADLAVAGQLDAAATTRQRTEIEQALTRHRARMPAEIALGELEQAAAGGGSWDRMLELAAQMHRAAGEQRVRYDELYQDRLRVLDAAARARPDDPDRWAALAGWLIDGADVKGERVVPRSEFMPYRFQLSRQDDLEQGIRAADRALAANARHVPAMMHKAMAFMGLKRYDDAESLADRALQISPDNADALRLYARFRASRAADLSAQAGALRQDRCSSSSRTENRSDGVYEVTTTTCVPPAQGDLARAAQLEAQAAELARRAQAALDRALRVTRGTVEGHLLQADVAASAGRAADAEAELREAIRQDPKSVEAQEALAGLYARTGQEDRAGLQLSVARQLIQTTAGPLLQLAWPRVARTAWQGAEEALVAARRLDPVDARTWAWLSVVRAGQGRAVESVALLRAAVALEEARLRMDDPAVVVGQPLPRDPLDFAVVMEARLRLAAALATAPAEALDVVRGNLAYESRMPEPLHGRQMFFAMWPDQKPEDGAAVPAPANASTLMARSRLAAGRLLGTLGQAQESRQMLEAAAALGTRTGTGTPRISNGRGDSNFAGEATAGSGDALMELMRQAMDAGDYRKAFELRQAVTRNKLTPAQLAELRRIDPILIPRMNEPGPGGASSAAAPRSGALDPALVGQWRGSERSSQGSTDITLDVDADGNYAYVGRGGSDRRQGRMVAAGGRMTLQNERGASEATYRFKRSGEDQALEISGTGWNAELTRVR